MLDFGVGCGRVIRWWKPLAGKVRFHGTDINEELVAWCRTNLDFGTYSVNSLLPPTELGDSKFDLLYAFSVFTHLTLETQESWLSEFRRILRPRGIALVSVHGDAHAKKLIPSLHEQYEQYLARGECVVSKDVEGDNLCATYQNRQRTEALFGKYFDVLDYMPEALTACGGQDLFVLRSKKQ